MNSATGLVGKVKSYFRSKNILPTMMCDHNYKPNGQVWDKISKKKFQLKDRSTCISCKTHRLVKIGEK